MKLLGEVSKVGLGEQNMPLGMLIILNQCNLKNSLRKKDILTVLLCLLKAGQISHVKGILVAPKGKESSVLPYTANSWLRRLCEHTLLGFLTNYYPSLTQLLVFCLKNIKAACFGHIFRLHIYDTSICKKVNLIFSLFVYVMSI